MQTHIQETALVEKGATIGSNTRVWHWAQVRAGAVVGANCNIGKGVFVDAGVNIGNNVKIQNNVSVFAGVTIEDGVFVGPHVCFTNDKNPRAVMPDGSPRSASDWTIAHTTVCEGASIGANATIVAGITLGSWCMVGSGAVVTRTVPPFALVLGNPARICGVVSRNGDVIARHYAPGLYHGPDDEEVEITVDMVAGIKLY